MIIGKTMRRAALVAALLGLGFAGLPSARAVSVISGFQSSGTVNGDRSFVRTGFVGLSTVLDTSNLATFNDGSLRYGTSSTVYGWNDAIPGDFGDGNDYALNPDRGDNATPFAGEANDPKSGTLAEVFGSSNLAYLMDGESDVAWELELFYSNNMALVNDGNANTPELLMLERGANSKLSVQAIRADGTYTSSILLDFSQGGSAGLTDYTLNTTEIGGSQAVRGLGVDLSEFGMGLHEVALGFRFFVKKDADGIVYNGPDLVGFVGTFGELTVVPEPSSIALAGSGLALGVLALRRRRRG